MAAVRSNALSRSQQLLMPFAHFLSHKWTFSSNSEHISKICTLKALATTGIDSTDINWTSEVTPLLRKLEPLLCTQVTF